MEIDPSENRNEFERRLNSIFSIQHLVNPYVLALMKSDTIEMDKCGDEMYNHFACIKKYLNDWDNAKSKEEKMKVVGSVTKSYEPTLKEISQARMK